MFVKIHGARDYMKGNTQSCSDLAQYLEKENEGKKFIEKDFFFNNINNHVMTSKVIQDIDNNVKTLKDNQAKFYMISVNPSPKELKHMAQQATGREISGIWEMNTEEKNRYNGYFKEYVNKVMDTYAKNFNRKITNEQYVDRILASTTKITGQSISDEKKAQVKDDLLKIIDNHSKGIKNKIVDINRETYTKDVMYVLQSNSKATEEQLKKIESSLHKQTDNFINYQVLTNNNLVYYAKIEQVRTYKGTDKDVKEGLVNQYYTNEDKEVQNGTAFLGDQRLKPGLQTHAHIIVSRMDKEQKISLSPLANSRGSEKHQLNGQSVQVGFDRDKFKENSEREFDYHYNYQRERGERFRDQNPYYGLQQSVSAKLKGKVVHQILAVDQSNSLLMVNNSINKVRTIAKDLKLAHDVVTGVASFTNPGYAAVKALTRFIKKVQHLGHGIEH